MGRSSEEGSRRRKRSTKSEAAEAKMASSVEGTRRRSRSMTSEAAESKMAASSSSSGRRILKLESEEDREILMTVKSEEGKILKLKKEFLAASEAGMLPTWLPMVKVAKPAGKKTKKVPVKWLMTMTKAQIDFVRAMAKHPCPTRNLTEDQLAERDQEFQNSYRQDILIRDTRLAYMNALIDQQENFGYVVDESEAEVTDDEGDDLVEN